MCSLVAPPFSNFLHATGLPRACGKNTPLPSRDIPEVLPPLALLEDSAWLALVLEPFIGKRLDAVLARQPRLALLFPITIGTRLTQALAARHTAGIVHPDIRSTSRLLRRDSVQVKLVILNPAILRAGTTSACPVPLIPLGTGHMS